MTIESLMKLKLDMEQELKNILNFWAKFSVNPEGNDFYGRVDSNLKSDKDAKKHLVLGSRLVWTFSAACRILGNPEYKVLARRAYDYFISNFIDREYGGAYWELNSDGSVFDDSKRVYGEAFAIYALSEYYRAFGDEAALKEAVSIYECLEKYAYHQTCKGYFEALTHKWEYEQEAQSSNINPFENTCKTMNTHLHLLEAYTSLYRVWKDDKLKNKLQEHIEVMIEKILDSKTAHYMLYFDQYWNSETQEVSYGHDIEGSWLLWEAAEVLDDEHTKTFVKNISINMAEAVYNEGWNENGGILYEKDPQGIIKSYRSWWVQAEAVVGFFNAWQLTGDKKYLDSAEKVWRFIKEEIVDHVNGGWFSYAISDKRMANRIDGWTCPYHNSRMCIEILERVNSVSGDII